MAAASDECGSQMLPLRKAALQPDVDDGDRQGPKSPYSVRSRSEITTVAPKAARPERSRAQYDNHAHGSVSYARISSSNAFFFNGGNNRNHSPKLERPRSHEWTLVTVIVAGEVSELGDARIRREATAPLGFTVVAFRMPAGPLRFHFEKNSPHRLE